jgi:DNA repair exonuclease SbcCD ATPase subunit
MPYKRVADCTPAELEAQRAKQRGYYKTYREKNPETVKANLEKSKLRNKEKRKEWDEKYKGSCPAQYARTQKNCWLKRNYGMTVDEFEQRKAAQDNRCPVCGETFTDTPHVDHCHATGKVRKLLCGQCNKALGLLKDNPVAFRNAAAYIEEHAHA